MELRSCRPAERLDAIRLSRSVFKDNMAEQFAVLFGEQNVGRMFVAVDDARVVAMVNYHFTPVLIGPSTINVASVGSVCTDPAYRGRGLASRLLRLAEEKMIAEGVHVVVISGEGGIYAAFGSGFAGDMREASVPLDRLPPRGSVATVPYDASYFPAVRRLYDADAVRFVRKDDEFRMLVRGQTFPDTFVDYDFRVILKDGVPAAYAILVLHKENDELGIKEMAGDRDVLRDALPLLCAGYGRKSVHFAAAPDDPLFGSVPPDCVKPIHQFASFKIIDFPGMAERLLPQFRIKIGADAEKLAFDADRGAATISGFGTTLRIADPRELVKIVFGCAGRIPSGASGCLGEVLAELFPVPFPWTHSVNYQ